jgi:stage II sporulation protein P
VAALAVWIVWLVGDPTAAVDELVRLADSAKVATALLSAELGTPGEGDGLSTWSKLVLAQSSLLGGVAAPEETVPVPSGEPMAIETPTVIEDPDDGEEEASLPPTTTAPEGIISRTLVAGTSAKYITSGDVSVYNHTDYTIDLDALRAAAPALSNQGDGPKVLIYHSHATEAYTMDGTDIYEPSSDYRTLDTNYNMVRVGAEMKAVFEAAGIEVIHDTTLYDYPSYNDAYKLSVQGVAAQLEAHPSLVLLIDVHRDALVDNDGTIYKAVAGTVDNCAQVMMVMGTDASGQLHPNWKVNLSLAVEIQDALSQRWATLARPIVLRGSRFNQHLSTGMLLVEVGTHGNTLQEAITAARLYARTVADLMTQP